MGTQQFCLKWNNHHSNMLVVFEQLLSSEALVDVTLACEGLSLKAHKMVLSACSPFFQSLFLENPCKHPIVILKDMRYTDLKAIIDFMYRGEVNVSQDQLSALLKTAETLKVKGLAEVTGDNRQGNGSGIVQQEIVQHNSTPQSSVPASGATTQHRAESPPLSRRKRGRPRRRSLSDSNRSDSEDQIPSKIKEPDSPEIIEDVNNDLTSDGVDVRQRLVSVPPLNQQSQVSSPNVPHLPPIASHKPHPALPSIHTQDARNVNMDENPSGDEADFEVDASKLMEQTMTTENVPVFADVQASGSSILPVSTQVALTSSTSGIVDTRPLQIAQVPASDSQALVPAPDQSVVLTSQDTTQDIKPMVSFEEPPISPVAGPSHGQDNSSSSLMMYMDTSGVPAIAGPSNYQPEKQTSSQQQSTQEQNFWSEERNIFGNQRCFPEIIGNSVYLGSDVHVDLITWNHLMASGRASLFIKRLSVYVFGIEVLKYSSVTGKASNRLISKHPVPARPGLCQKKMKIMKDCYKYYLLHHGLPVPEQKRLESKVNYEVGQKISKLNRAAKPEKKQQRK